MRHINGLWLMLPALISADRASGELVTWSFTGAAQVVQVGEGPFSGMVRRGSPLVGTLTFDTSTPDALPNNPLRGGYYIGASWSLDFQLGDFRYEHQAPISQPTIFVDNDFYEPSVSRFIDKFSLIATLLQFGPEHGFVDLLLFDQSAAMFQSDALPTFPPPLPQGLNGAIFGVSSPSFNAISLLSSLSLVPEPTTGLLGFLAAVLLMRRRVSKPARRDS